jgi:hypothetical protein
LLPVTREESSKLMEWSDGMTCSVKMTP